jgi:hypothetical protein
MQSDPGDSQALAERSIKTIGEPLTLLAVFRLVLRNKWAIVAAVVVATVAAVLFVALVPPTYVARAFIAPTQSTDASAALGQLQQLAGLFDASLGPNRAALSEFTAVVRSRITAEKVAAESDVLQRLFPDRWDKQTGTWREPSGVVPALRRLVYEGLLGIPLPEPGPDMLLNHIDERLRIAASSNNPGLIEVSYRSRDPDFALDFLSAVMQAAEFTLLERYRDINEASLSYATKELERPHPVEVRQALGSLVLGEMRRAVTLASGRLDTIRIVLLPEVNYIPQRPSLVVSVFLFNLVCVLLVVAFLIVMRRPTPAQA